MLICYRRTQQIFKPISVKTSSGQMHLSATDHVGAAALAHVVRSAQMNLTGALMLLLLGLL